MPNTVMISTARRPSLSPIGPNTTAPKGRDRKPTANTANDDSSETPGAVDGKNSCPMTAAK
ncbi:hypothetical protein D3C77_178730 [compost metagenome]